MLLLRQPKFGQRVWVGLGRAQTVSHFTVMQSDDDHGPFSVEKPVKDARDQLDLLKTDLENLNDELKMERDKQQKLAKDLDKLNQILETSKDTQKLEKELKDARAELETVEKDVAQVQEYLEKSQEPEEGKDEQTLERLKEAHDRLTRELEELKERVKAKEQ